MNGVELRGKRRCPKCGHWNAVVWPTCRNPKPCDFVWKRKDKTVTTTTTDDKYNAQGKEGVDYKRCPKCDYKCHPRTMKCQNPTGCNQRWDPIERDKPITFGTGIPVPPPPFPTSTPTTASVPAPTVETASKDFGCGYMDDGTVFLWWPKENKILHLTEKQTDVMYYLLMGEQRAPRRVP